MATAGGNQPQAKQAGLSVEAGAEAIFDLLPPEPGDEPEPKKKVEDKQDVEDDSDEPVEETDEDEEADDEVKEPSKETPPAPKLHRVKVDGKEIEVTEDELRNGYSRTQDYTRKTQAVAEKERAVAAKEAEALKEKAEYAERVLKLDAVLAKLVDEEPEPDWAAIQAEDPENYLARHAAWTTRQQQRVKVREEANRVREGQRQEAQRQRQEYVRREFEQLVEHLPELKDPAKGRALLREVFTFAEQEYGFTQEELQNTSDHRALRAVHDAMQFRRAQQKVREAKDKAAGTATLTPGPEPKPKDALEGAMQRARRTGSVADGAAVIEKLLK